MAHVILNSGCHEQNATDCLPSITEMCFLIVLTSGAQDLSASQADSWQGCLSFLVVSSLSLSPLVVPFCVRSSTHSRRPLVSLDLPEVAKLVWDQGPILQTYLTPWNALFSNAVILYLDETTVLVLFQQGAMLWDCNPNSWKTKARGLWVWNQCGTHGEFKVKLSYPSQNKQEYTTTTKTNKNLGVSIHASRRP